MSHLNEQLKVLSIVVVSSDLKSAGAVARIYYAFIKHFKLTGKLVSLLVSQQELLKWNSRYTETSVSR